MFVSFPQGVQPPPHPVEAIVTVLVRRFVVSVTLLPAAKVRASNGHCGSKVFCPATAIVEKKGWMFLP